MAVEAVGSFLIDLFSFAAELSVRVLVTSISPWR